MELSTYFPWAIHKCKGGRCSETLQVSTAKVRSVSRRHSRGVVGTCLVSPYPWGRWYTVLGTVTCQPRVSLDLRTGKRLGGGGERILDNGKKKSKDTVDPELILLHRYSVGNTRRFLLSYLFRFDTLSTERDKEGPDR